MIDKVKSLKKCNELGNRDDFHASFHGKEVEIIEECKRIENIKRNVGEFLKIISDMNCITFNESISIADFKKIYSFIFPKTKKEEIYKNNKGYFILNVPRTINEENILWWGKNDGEYTREIYNAKIFAEKEMIY